MAFRIIRNDITKVEADAIVNTANPEVAVGAGVDAAIYKAAGMDVLLKARAEIGVLEPGEVGITPAFGLNAKYIIHSCGPVWCGGMYGEKETLHQCYDKALHLAVEHGCESIAFPLMATGTYGFPQDLGIQIAVDAFRNFLEENELDITLVVFGEEAYKISGKLFEDVRSFIDNQYVEEALEEELYLEDSFKPETPMYSMPQPMPQSMPEPMLERSEPTRKEKTKKSFFAGMWGGASVERRKKVTHFELAEEEEKAHSFAGTVESEELIAPMGSAKLSLDDQLKQMYTDSFEKHLQQLINKKGMKNSEVYAAANISKQYFSKLMKGQVKPSKEKVLALAVGLKLNMDEAVDFLRIAGYAFSPVSQTDVVVEYFIQKKDYNVMKIDIVLFDYGLPALSE